MNELQEKSKGLKKVMQPRMAYKYAPRENSSSELIAMQAQSQYAFSGRKTSNIDREQALNLYNRRAKSIGMGVSPGVPNAAPSSGNNGVMINDTSATQLKDDSPNKNNEVIVVAPGMASSNENPTQGNETVAE